MAGANGWTNFVLLISTLITVARILQGKRSRKQDNQNARPNWWPVKHVNDKAGLENASQNHAYFGIPHSCRSCIQSFQGSLHLGFPGIGSAIPCLCCWSPSCWRWRHSPPSACRWLTRRSGTIIFRAVSRMTFLQLLSPAWLACRTKISEGDGRPSGRQKGNNSVYLGLGIEQPVQSRNIYIAWQACESRTATVASKARVSLPPSNLNASGKRMSSDRQGNRPDSPSRTCHKYSTT